MDTLIEIIGDVAAVMTTAGFIPQAIKVIRSKNTKSISLAMYIMFVFGTILWLIYGIAKVLWPVIIANALTALLASVVLTYKIINVIQAHKLSKKDEEERSVK